MLGFVDVLECLGCCLVEVLNLVCGCMFCVYDVWAFLLRACLLAAGFA